MLLTKFFFIGKFNQHLMINNKKTVIRNNRLYENNNVIF